MHMVVREQPDGHRSIDDLNTLSSVRTDAMTKVTGPARQGTGVHRISATRKLTLKAAVKEPLDNTIGMAPSMVDEAQLDVFLTPLPVTRATQPQPRGGNEQMIGDYLVFLSNTRIGENAWSHFFDQKPTIPGESDPSHAASVFNSGAKDSFEALTGGKNSNLFVFAQRKVHSQDAYEHLVGRYGSALDKVRAGDGEWANRIQFPWDVKKESVLGTSQQNGAPESVFHLTSNSPLDDDSQSKTRKNISDVFRLLHDKRSQRGADEDDEWFALVMGPLDTVTLKAPGQDETSHPVVRRSDDGTTLELYDSTAPPGECCGT